MKTRAVALMAIPINYPLGPNEVTCNFLNNSYCPILEGEIVEYSLKMFIEPWFPTIPVTIEFRVEDKNAVSVWCIRLPIVVQHIFSPPIVCNAPNILSVSNLTASRQSVFKSNRFMFLLPLVTVSSDLPHDSGVFFSPLFYFMGGLPISPSPIMGDHNSGRLEALLAFFIKKFPDAYREFTEVNPEIKPTNFDTDSPASPDCPKSNPCDMDCSPIGSEAETDSTPSSSDAEEENDGFKPVLTKSGKRKAAKSLKAPPPTKKPLTPAAAGAAAHAPADTPVSAPAGTPVSAPAGLPGSAPKTFTKYPPPLYIRTNKSWNSISSLLNDKKIK
ncbi:unnamed protein product [Danaus chrysippus]|uniref:(African queen) hypothetical protein n=1 Tax=Danaus chrysippus TaxID=151541 RepID=A0A8J2W8R1_9NEOP|nr:unnamed protein product [Danaus chrysippus]